MMSANLVRPRPVIDGYALLDMQPATGRTASVYKAVSLRDGSFVAIKALSASVEQGDFLEEAFRRETQALAELRHLNIVKMLDSGINADGVRYIILEWMESDLLARKKASPQFEWSAFWSSLGRPLAVAVAHAHSRDIAHRDLAPRNILFDGQNTPKVADFGISKLRRFLRSEQTLREFISPPFTPPEADDGSGILARDVFALVSLFCWYASPADLTTYEEVGSVDRRAKRTPLAG
ncbi:protein kinase domain-containing protein [Sphingobium sp. WCS2017Hpa-17]|uniref:protein kinase domain-containing protein n=1 Tax=Sphingobium sp. WCS2017Hpa-17 TaxID=3073638 RepID=UPI0028897927|nr:protein kinase [Sphingobium sp. WCS2017Hpa-17]